MGERVSVVSIEARFDTSEAEGKARSLGDSLLGVGEAGAEAALNTDKLDASVAKLDQASGRGLLRAITQTSVEVATLKEELASLAPESAEFARIQAAVDSGNVAIQNGIGKLAVYREELRAVNEQVKIGMASHAAFGGSMGGLSQTVAGVTTKFGQLAIGMAGLTLAIEGPKMAYEALKKTLEAVDEGFKSIGELYVEHVAVTHDATAAEVLHEAAMRAVEKGLITMGSSLEATDGKYQSFIENTLRASKSIDAFAAGTAKIKDVPQEFSKVSAAAGNMNTALALAFGEGKARFLEYALATESANKKTVESYKINGEKVPEYIQKAVDAVKKWNKAQEEEVKQTERAKHAMEDKLKEYQKQFDMNEKLGALVEKVVENSQKEIQAAKDEAAAVIAAGELKIASITRVGKTEEEYFQEKRAVEAEVSAVVSAALAKEMSAQANLTEGLVKLGSQEKKTGQEMQTALVAHVAMEKTTRELAQADGVLVTMSGVLANGLTQAGAGATKAAQDLDGLQKSVAALPVPAESAAKGINAIGAAKPPSQALTDGIEKMTKQLEKLAEMKGKPADAIDKLGTAADTHTKSVTDLSDAVGELSKNLMAAAGEPSPDMAQAEGFKPKGGG